MNVAQNEELLSSLRTLLREEFQQELRPLQGKVDRVQSDLSGTLERISALERCSHANSPRSAMRSGSSEPPRKLSRSSIAFSQRSNLDPTEHVSADTLVFNGFPEKVNRTELQQWLQGQIAALVDDTEIQIYTRRLYSTRATVAFSSPSKAKQLSDKWRREARSFVKDSVPSRIYVSWRVSPARAREEYLWRQMYRYCLEVLKHDASVVEKERSSRSVYINQTLFCHVQDESVVLSAYGRTMVTVKQLETWTKERQEQSRTGL